MKTTARWLPILTLMALSGVARAGLPLAPTVTYGLIRDEFGLPYTAGAVVALVKADETISASQAIDGMLLPGVNYRLSLELDSSAPVSRPQAALVGDPILLTVSVGGIRQPVTPSPQMLAGEPGTAQRLDFATGHSSANDGIPDAWKELMVLLSDGFFTSIDDIKAHEDPDKDGYTNLEEFRAGTLPFCATSVFAVTDLQRVPGTSLLQIRFATTDSSRQYRILTGPAGGPWAPAASSATVDGELRHQTYSGTYRTRTVFVDGSHPAAFFRVAVN